jgi:hypothetical protein
MQALFGVPISTANVGMVAALEASAASAAGVQLALRSTVHELTRAGRETAPQDQIPSASRQFTSIEALAGHGDAIERLQHRRRRGGPSAGSGR